MFECVFTRHGTEGNQVIFLKDDLLNEGGDALVFDHYKAFGHGWLIGLTIYDPAYNVQRKWMCYLMIKKLVTQLELQFSFVCH